MKRRASWRGDRWVLESTVAPFPTFWQIQVRSAQEKEVAELNAALRASRHTGIICPIDGRVGLTAGEYESQLAAASTRWFCPVCGQWAEWDQARYDAQQQEEP